MSDGKPAARVGDVDTGHGKYPPTPVNSGAGSVTIGGKPAARVGDTLAPHHRGVRVIAKGSSSVMIAGKPAARVGDPINCGGVLASGEGSVCIGDGPAKTAAGPLSAAFTEFLVHLFKAPKPIHSPEARQALLDSIAVKYEPKFLGDTVGQLKPEFAPKPIPKSKSILPGSPISSEQLLASFNQDLPVTHQISPASPLESIDILATDADGSPADGLGYHAIAADDSEHKGSLNSKGQATIAQLPPGNVRVTVGGADKSPEIRQLVAALREKLQSTLQAEKVHAQRLSADSSGKPALKRQWGYQKTGIRGLWNSTLGVLGASDDLTAMSSYDSAAQDAWARWLYSNVKPHPETFSKNFSKAQHKSLMTALGIHPASLGRNQLAEIGVHVNFIRTDDQAWAGLTRFASEFVDAQASIDLPDAQHFSASCLVTDLLFTALALNAGANLAVDLAVEWGSHLREIGGLLTQLATEIIASRSRTHATGSTGGRVELTLTKPNFHTLEFQSDKTPVHQAAVRVRYPNGKPYPLATEPSVIVNGYACAMDNADADANTATKFALAKTDEVSFQLRDDAPDRELVKLRSQIKQGLAVYITALKAETARKDALFYEEGILNQGLILAGATATGLIDSVVGLFEFIGDAAGAAYDAAVAVNKVRQYINTVPSRIVETLWKNYQNGEEFDYFEGLKAESAAEFAEIFGVTPAEVNRAMTEAYEIFTFVMADDELKVILLDFAEDYARSQSITDYFEMSGGIAFEIILTVLMAVLTGGAGNVAQVAAKVRQVDKLEPVAKLLREFVRQSKAKLVPKQVSGVIDETTDVVVRVPDAPRISRPQVSNVDAGVPSSSIPSTTPSTTPRRAPDGPEVSDGQPKNSNTNEPGTNQNGDVDQPANCTRTSGCPISLITGEELLSHVDFAIPGPLGQVWTRTYRSSNPHDRGMGHGWTHSFSDVLIFWAEKVALRDSESRLIKFDVPAIGHHCINSAEQLRLYRTGEKSFAVASTQPGVQITRHFGQVSAHAHLSLTKISDPFGNHIDFTYDEGRLTQIAAVGHRFALAYSNAHLSTVTWHTPNGEHKQLAHYEYDTENDLVRAEDAVGNSERYAYQNHLIKRRTLKSGYRFYFEWDAQDSTARCLRNWGDDIEGQPTYNYRFLWDDKNHSVTVTDTRGGQTTTQFNDKAKIIFERLPEGGETHWLHDASGNVVQTTDALGNVEKFEYDAQQRLASAWGKLGEKSELVRDAAGNVAEIVDAAGSRWQRQYNAVGQVVAQINPLGERVTYRYNAMGLLNTLVDAQGQQWHYIWDNEARLLAIKNPAGQQSRYSYNDFGELAKITWPDGQEKHCQYNPAGCCTRITHSDGKTEHFEYSALGLVTAYEDRAGRKTQYQYNGLSQVVRRVDPTGQILEYQYDGERNLVGLVNEKGEHYQLRYDLDERLIEEVGFDQRVQRYEYNALGHLISSADYSRDGVDLLNKIAFTRDAGGRLTEQVDALSQTVLGQYSYDISGRLHQAVNPHRKLRWTYDPVGRVLEDWQDDQVITHRYAAGRRTHTLLPEGEALTYHYGAQGEFKGLDFNGTRISDIERDAVGRELKRTLSNAVVTESQYDPQGRLVSQRSNKVLGDNPIKTLSERQYHYNSAGQLSQIDDQLRGTTQYHYDMLDRLTSVEGPGPEAFIHDPAGNVLSQAGGDDKEAVVQGNRLPFHGDAHFQYDARGNRITQARGKAQRIVTHYDYDALNQLTEVRQGPTCTRYAYDPLGRRIRKSTDEARVDFTWFDDVLLYEKAVTADSPKAKLKTYLYEPGTFKPLAFVENSQIYHYHLDHLGTPQEITNAQGEVVWAVSFKAYGNLAVAHTQLVENNLRFQGQYYDDETGLHYNRFRYYDPGCGRFVNQDPIGLAGGRNSYQYAPNPIRWIDPLGLTARQGDCPKIFSNSSSLDSKYIGENDANNPDRWNYPDVVQYLDEIDRKKYELEVQNGLLVNKQTGAPFDSGESQTLWGGAIFVMDEQGRIFASNYQKRGVFHHSSLAGGSNIAAAGNIEVVNGMLLKVDNQSGHYMPSQSQNSQLFSELERRGMSSEALDQVERAGWTDKGDPIAGKTHGEFRKADNWKPGDYIPDDWSDF